MLLGSKSVPRPNGIPCLRRDRSALTCILDKPEATCIRHVEWKDTGRSEIGRSSKQRWSGRYAMPFHIRYEDAAEHLSELTAQSCTASRWRELNVLPDAVSSCFPEPAVLLCPVIQRSVLTLFHVYLAVHFSLLAQRGPIRALQRWTLAFLNDLPTMRSRIPVKLSACGRRSFHGATQEISLTKSP
jgi:hypothetical protein